MNEQNMRFRIGVFVLSSLILLAALVMLFGRWPTLFKRPDHYVIIFQNAPGVEEGTPVRRSGVRIGQVLKVELDDATGRVRAIIDIDRPHPLYETDQAVLVHGILSGDTSIDFAPARMIAPDTEPVRLQPGAELIGGVQADVPMLLNQTSAMVPTAQQALDEIRATLKRYEKVAPLVEDALKQYTELGKALNAAAPDFRDTLKNVKDAVPEFRALVKTAQGLEPDLRKTNEEVQVAIRNWGRVGERVNVLLESNETKLTETVDRVNQAAGRALALLSDENQKNINETLRNFSATSKNLDSLSRNFDDFLKEARQSAKQIDETIKLTEQVMANLQKATKPIADRSENLMKNLEELTDGLNKTLVETRDLLRIYSQADGTLNRLLTDPSLFNNVNDTVLLINRSLPRLDLILEDIQVFSDKLARHPELLGLGGAVRGSAGLKDSPFAPPQPRFGGGH